MSAALVDFLIELAEPEKLEKFEANPEAALSASNLSETEKAALRSRDRAQIRYATQDHIAGMQVVSSDLYLAIVDAVDVVVIA